MSKKRNNKEPMICFNAKTKPKKISKIISLWPPSNPDLNLLDYAIWGILEDKTNSTSHPSVGLLKTAIEKDGNKMSEKCILKAYKSFRRHVGTIIEKITAILSKFTVLCLSSYFVSFF